MLVLHGRPAMWLKRRLRQMKSLQRILPSLSCCLAVSLVGENTEEMRNRTRAGKACTAAGKKEMSLIIHLGVERVLAHPSPG